MKTFAIVAGAVGVAAITSGIVLAVGPVPGYLTGVAILTAVAALIARLIVRK